jgi:DNA polymerase-3 subunit delta'
VTEHDRVERLVRLAGGCPGQALALNDDGLWAFRETLVSYLTAAKADPVGFATAWIRFVEEVGKESASQRERASLVIRLLMDVLRNAMRLAVGSELGSSNDGRLRRYADQVGPEYLADLLEHCAEADFQVTRKVQLVLVIESLVDKLLQSSSVRR